VYQPRFDAVSGNRKAVMRHPQAGKKKKAEARHASFRLFVIRCAVFNDRAGWERL
jgi:hypothetical protein